MWANFSRRVSRGKFCCRNFASEEELGVWDSVVGFSLWYFSQASATIPENSHHGQEHPLLWQGLSGRGQNKKVIGEYKAQWEKRTRSSVWCVVEIKHCCYSCVLRGPSVVVKLCKHKRWAGFFEGKGQKQPRSSSPSELCFRCPRSLHLSTHHPLQ